MSAKRNNLNTSGNTLFNYFARSPSTPKSDKTVAKPAASPLTSKKNTPTSSKNLGAGKIAIYSDLHIDMNVRVCHLKCLDC